jgi:hypothetical protein
VLRKQRLLEVILKSYHLCVGKIGSQSHGYARGYPKQSTEQAIREEERKNTINTVATAPDVSQETVPFFTTDNCEYNVNYKVFSGANHTSTHPLLKPVAN